MEARWCTSSVGRDKVSTELFGGGLCALSTTEIRLSHEQEDIAVVILEKNRELKSYR